jgi:hypothetical protein
MLKAMRTNSWTPVSALLALNATFVVIYLALIAVAMTYAALEVEFTQYTKNDEATVASLEATYLSSLTALTTTNYVAEGYAQPIAQIFVPGAPQTALNIQ